MTRQVDLTADQRAEGPGGQLRAEERGRISVRLARAPAEGGWNIHNTNWYATDVMDPVRSAPAAANGDNAWFGWPDFPQVEELRTKFALTSDPAEQKKIADELQRIGIDEGLYVPLGQMSVPTVYTTKLSGLVHAPVFAFWNVKKAP